MRTRFSWHFIFLILSMGLSIGTHTAHASMYAAVDFDTLVNGSELVFEGRVISKDEKVDPASGIPFTYFLLEIIDIVKGTYPDAAIELGYMGGSLGKRRLIISDMRMPEVGERGIYFVETLSEQQIHPLFGWQQGHYLVVPNRTTGKNLVQPVEQERTGRGLSLSTQSVTVEKFKESIRNAAGAAR